WRRSDRHRGAIKAQLSLARQWHDRVGADDTRRGPDLSFAWRSQSGWFDRGAALSQAAGAADLAGRGGDGDWGGVLARGPAASHWGAEAGQEQGCAAASGIEPRSRTHMRILRVAYLLLIASTLLTAALLSTPRIALAVQPDEMLADPALEGR